MRHVITIALAASTLAACATTADDDTYGDVVSVQYDPNRFLMADLQRTAEAQCSAKGYAMAEPLKNEPNTESVRWSYLTFGCFNAS